MLRALFFWGVSYSNFFVTKRRFECKLHELFGCGASLVTTYSDKMSERDSYETLASAPNPVEQMHLPQVSLLWPDSLLDREALAWFSLCRLV